MDNLAIELVTLISFYACTDGGVTGCSLSLVSHRIRVASRPARFFSVAIFDSPTKIEQFIACFQAERARADDVTPRVHHLCLSLCIDSRAIDEETSDSTRFMSAKLYLARERRGAQQRLARETLKKRYDHAVSTLFREVSGEIQSLALIQDPLDIQEQIGLAGALRPRSPSAIDYYFPALRELTIVGGDPTFLPFSPAPESRALFPALKRLHHLFAWVNKEVDLRAWAKHAPKVTHLRVSRLGEDHRTTVETLSAVVCSQAAAKTLLRHLEVVVVSPTPRPFGDSGAFLKHLSEKARAGTMVIVLPVSGKPKPVSDVERPLVCTTIKHEWMERIEGGTGCWALAELSRMNAVASGSQS